MVGNEEIIKKYQELLPARISVRIDGSSDEGYWAKITSPEGDLANCYTQAESIPELMVMITDAVQTHFEVPEEIRQAVGSYIPLSQEHMHWETMFNKLAALEKEGGEANLTLSNSLVNC